MTTLRSNDLLDASLHLQTVRSVWAALGDRPQPRQVTVVLDGIYWMVLKVDPAHNRVTLRSRDHHTISHCRLDWLTLQLTLGTVVTQRQGDTP